MPNARAQICIVRAVLNRKSRSGTQSTVRNIALPCQVYISRLIWETQWREDGLIACIAILLHGEGGGGGEKRCKKSTGEKAVSSSLHKHRRGDLRIEEVKLGAPRLAAMWLLYN